MIFRISGVDNTTGAQRSVRLMADSEQDAIAKARANGILTYNVERDQAAEAKEKEKQAVRAKQEQHQQQVERVLVSTRDIALNQLRKGVTVFLYEKLYMPVDSLWEGEPVADLFSTEELQRLGMLGWELVQIIPRTNGFSLNNHHFGSESGISVGAATGGNVIGVYAVLRKSVRSVEEYESTTEEIETYIRKNFAAFIKLQPNVSSVSA